MMDQSTRDKTTTEIIATSLRDEILQGKLTSNQPLRQDEIASQFGVSKIPVREALAQLKVVPVKGDVVRTARALGISFGD